MILYEELIADDTRNRLICDDVVQAVREGRSPLILTERNEHLDRLADLLPASIHHLVVLRGGMGRKEIRATIERLAAIPESESRVLLATGRYVGEGFDDARLDTLFLTLPVSWRGTIAQYVGRLHRLHHCKREVRVYDYADLNVPMLARMFDRRCRGYESVGYTILLPASAVPGWPADVPLPIDPQWKNDYAASVRRLIRDGVDKPLANLFVHVAHTVTPDSEGIARARSATEAFLYRRLETMPETAGRFQLNAELSIPFDGGGKWRRICFVLTLVWRSKSTVCSIWPTWRLTVGTAAKISYYRRTAISCCGFWPKTSARALILCSTQSCERCHIIGREYPKGVASICDWPRKRWEKSLAGICPQFRTLRCQGRRRKPISLEQVTHRQQPCRCLVGTDSIQLAGMPECLGSTLVL